MREGEGYMEKGMDQGVCVPRTGMIVPSTSDDMMDADKNFQMLLGITN